jgi:histidine triad (HIT) family protein
LDLYQITKPQRQQHQAIAYGFFGSGLPDFYSFIKYFKHGYQMNDSVFTKIIRGEIPANKIYEDDLTLAFLTIAPVQSGHTLVIPKKQIDHLWDLPDEDYRAVMETAKKVANRMREVFPEKSRIGVKVVGEEVPHAHVHLIPFNSIEEYNNRPGSADPEELKAIAKKLAF